MSSDHVLVFTYKNHRDEVKERRVFRPELFFGQTKYYEGEQWFLTGYDLDKNENRDFAVARIIRFGYGAMATTRPHT